LLFKTLLLDVLVLSFPSEIKNIYGVTYQVLLNVKVEGRICRKAGGLIHLQEPRLAFRVDEDVETEDLKAHRVLQVIGFGTSVKMRNARLPSDESLHNDLFDVLPDLLCRLI
jgi:hypothetical protein